MKMQQLPEPKIDLEGMLPDKVAIDPQPIDHESKALIFSFEKYNKRLCEIDDLKKNAPKNILKYLRDVGLMQDQSVFKRKRLSESTKDSPIKNAGEYSKLFRGLSEDTELRERKIGGTHRLFYFIVGRTFYIILMKNSHFETKKHRK